MTDSKKRRNKPNEHADTLISEELFARYVKALDRLPERCREVFIRLREEKQSYAQVAEELNISTKTVDAQLQKALTRLKEALLAKWYLPASEEMIMAHIEGLENLHIVGGAGEYYWSVSEWDGGKSLWWYLDQIRLGY